GIFGFQVGGAGGVEHRRAALEAPALAGLAHHLGREGGGGVGRGQLLGSRCRAGVLVCDGADRDQLAAGRERDATLGLAPLGRTTVAALDGSDRADPVSHGLEAPPPAMRSIWARISSIWRRISSRAGSCAGAEWAEG